MNEPAPPRPAEDLTAWNDAMVARYDIDAYYADAHPLVRWVEARRLRALDALAAAAPGERLLEVGCGGGHVLMRYPDQERWGIDLSSVMLERSARRVPGARLARASADRLPFASGSFDVVLCTEVLEHVPDPGAVVAELMRVAAPGARVVVSIPNEGLIDRTKRVLSRLWLLRGPLRRLAGEGNEWHLHAFDLRLLRQVCAGHARVARVRSVPFRMAPVRYVARLRPPARP